MNPPVAPGSPLVDYKDKQPLLYSALGASFCLEGLVPKDEAALEEVNAEVVDWFGTELRWTLNSGVASFEPFRLEDMEFVSCYPNQLKAPMDHVDDPRLHEAEQWLSVDLHNQFGLFCHGASRPRDGSPYSYSFFSEMHWLTGGPIFHTCPILKLTVPLAWPIADFEKRVRSIASKLRLRWGSAGLTYAYNSTDGYDLVHEGIYRHARRYVGYDPGIYVAYMNHWFRTIRSVSWLTFVGARMTGDLAASKSSRPPLETNELVDVSNDGANVVLRAGSRPDAGDLNRLLLPRAYQRADEMVRPLRARSEVVFPPPWDESTTEQWLRRFEKRIL
jgi:hypothetical protein